MMKIGPLENKSALAPANANRKPAADGAAPASSNPEPSAKVELSAAASVIASGLADGSFDAQKVERLSRAIRDGHYQIDPQAIADVHDASHRDVAAQATWTGARRPLSACWRVVPECVALNLSRVPRVGGNWRWRWRSASAAVGHEERALVADLGLAESSAGALDGAHMLDAALAVERLTELAAAIAAADRVQLVALDRGQAVAHQRARAARAARAACRGRRRQPQRRACRQFRRTPISELETKSRIRLS
jgi:negative regulator of flagellin synthesis FlgM